MAEIVPSVKIQDFRDMNDIFEFVNEEKTKYQTMIIFFLQKRTKREGEEKKMQRLGFCDFLKRE